MTSYSEARYALLKEAGEVSLQNAPSLAALIVFPEHFSSFFQ